MSALWMPFFLMCELGIAALTTELKTKTSLRSSSSVPTTWYK